MRWHVEVRLSNGTWRAVRPSGEQPPYALESREAAWKFARSYYPDHTRAGDGVRVTCVDDTGKRVACCACTTWVSDEQIVGSVMGFNYYRRRDGSRWQGGKSR